MANYTNLNSLFTAIADAIREKTESTAKIIADNFPTEINNLKTGFDYNNPDVVEIPDYAFYGCEDLKSVDCCNLTSIGTSAFENCINLKSVVLYDNVVNVIGANAFYGCTALESINYTGTIAQWNAITFGGEWNYRTGNYTIYCTDGTIAKS